MIIALARLVGRLSKRMPPVGARVINPGPEIGTFVENWEAEDLTGRAVGYVFPREKGVLVIYVSPHCTVCSSLLPSAKRFFKEVAHLADGAWVMVMGNPETQLDYARRNALLSQPVFTEESLPASWRVEGAPFAMWISAEGEVKTKGMVNHREHLESLKNAVVSGHPSIESYLGAVAEKREQKRDVSNRV